MQNTNDLTKGCGHVALRVDFVRLVGHGAKIARQGLRVVVRQHHKFAAAHAQPVSCIYSHEQVLLIGAAIAFGMIFVRSYDAPHHALFKVKHCRVPSQHEAPIHRVAVPGGLVRVRVARQ